LFAQFNCENHFDRLLTLSLFIRATTLSLPLFSTVYRAIRAYTQVYLSYTQKTCGLCRKFKGSLLGICVPLLFLLDFNVTSKHGQNSWAFLQFRFCISSQKLNRISKWKHTRWDESAFYDERLNGVRTSNDTSSKNS
jgi:hypothetical protein